MDAADVLEWLKLRVGYPKCLPGVVRLPMNLIMGVRSAAAACLRTLVANIVELVLWREKVLIDVAGDGIRFCRRGRCCCVREMLMLEWEGEERRKEEGRR